MGCGGCKCEEEDCLSRHQLDWDTRVELLEIELEVLRQYIQAIRDKFDKFIEGL
jgi:hypothetical protein